MSFKIYKMRYYCDVVNVQPHFNFSDEIIILNLELLLKNNNKKQHRKLFIKFTLLLPCS